MVSALPRGPSGALRHLPKLRLGRMKDAAFHLPYRVAMGEYPGGGRGPRGVSRAEHMQVRTWGGWYYAPPSKQPQRLKARHPIAPHHQMVVHQNAQRLTGLDHLAGDIDVGAGGGGVAGGVVVDQDDGAGR